MSEYGLPNPELELVHEIDNKHLVWVEAEGRQQLHKRVLKEDSVPVLHAHENADPSERP
jgi:hypothetical protein